MSESIIQITGLRYRNSSSMSVREVNINSAHIARVLHSSKLIFARFDRESNDQTWLIRIFWQLRTQILFSLLPFDSQQNSIQEKLELFISEARNVPSLADYLNDFSEAVYNLFKNPKNPKAQWIIQNEHIGTQRQNHLRIGLFTAMTRGSSFTNACCYSPDNNLPENTRIICNRKQLLEGYYDKIVLLGTCQYLSSKMLTEIFYMGRTEAIDILLYPGERFNLKDRLIPPDSSIFRGRTSVRPIRITRLEVPSSDDDTDDDAELDRAFWDMSHDGERSAVLGYVEARYVLLNDGRGVFARVGTRNLYICRDEFDYKSRQVVRLSIDNVMEGDWLVILPQNIELMLDQFSSAQGFNELLENSNDWKLALERFMLTATPQDFARLMQLEGARGLTLQNSIRNWIDGSVYGPAQRNEFQILITILVKRGLLECQTNLNDYIDSAWRSLQSYRESRHRAGTHIRLEISELIEKALNNLSELSIQPLKLNNDLVVQLVQVVAVDERISWVAPSRLMKIRVLGE